MSRLGVLFLVALAAAVLARFQPTHSSVFRDKYDEYRFFVDQLCDGRYLYTAQLVGLAFPVLDQEESGILSQRDWDKLINMQPVTSLPPADPAALSDPDEEWGTMERGGSKRKLRYCDWTELEGKELGEAYHRLVSKANAGW